MQAFVTGHSPPSDGIAFINGRYVPLSEACVPILDRGFVRSDATYDVAHVWKGRFFRLDDHIERFRHSMDGLRMSLPNSAAQIKDILIECVRRSGLRDAYVQMTCTRGVPPAGTRDPRLCENRLYAFAQPFVWIADEEQRRAGLTMIVSSVERIAPEALDPRIKNFHWLDLTMGILEAYDRCAAVAVLLNREGHVTEGAGFNVFTVMRGEIATPDWGMFEGITRRTVFELCRMSGIPVVARPVSAAELKCAEELFITSTAGGIMPVVRLNDGLIGTGTPGPITTSLCDRYWSLHEDAVYSTPVAYPDGR